MARLSRTDASVLGRWWWAVDRWSLAAILIIIAVGGLLALAASPPVAERLGLDTFYFARRHLIMMPVAVAVMLAISLLDNVNVRRLSLALFVVALALMAASLVVGDDIKGARRWLVIFGVSVQPSELLSKLAWVVSAKYRFLPQNRHWLLAVRWIGNYC